MENILFATNATGFNRQSLDFACYVGDITGSKIRGIFLEDLPEKATEPEEHIPADITAIAPAMKKKDKEILALRNINLFRQHCADRKLCAGVHRDHGAASSELIKESRFADLLILDIGLCYNNTGEMSDHFLKHVLHDIACPVLICPDEMYHVKQLVFAYDGTDSAIRAIKEFSHLLPYFSNTPLIVITVNDNENGCLKDGYLLNELLSTHYSHITYETVVGKPADELFVFLLRQPDTMTIMGAFGRTFFSQFFKRSTAELILKTLPQATFIAHQ